MRYQRILILILIGWYLVLALGHYLNQRPLWNDELCVFNSIVHQQPSELFTAPLLSGQAFPRLHLWAIQQFSSVFHQNLLSLRFFSFVFMILGFFVWIKIAKKVLGESLGLALFVGCWSASMPLVYYAAELKPYSMDVLAAGLIVWFLLDQEKIKQNIGSYQIILFLMPFLGLWSYVAIFLLALPLYNLMLESVKQHRCIPELIIYGLGLSIALILFYFFDYRVSPHHQMVEIWHDFFISMDSWKDFLKTFGKGMTNLVSRRFAENPKWVKIPQRFFLGAGVLYMVSAWLKPLKKERFLLCSVIPIAFVFFALQLLLACLWLYPFGVPRMSLFFSPLLILMTIMAMDYLSQYFKMAVRIFRGLFVCYLIFISLGVAYNIFIKKDLGAESELYNRH